MYRKKNQLFVKYLIINFSLIGVILAGFILNVFYTYYIVKENIVEQNNDALAQSSEELEEILNSIYSLSSTLRSNDSLRELRGYSGEKLPSDKYVFMNYLQKDLSDFSMIANISGIGCVIFRNNQVFVSNYQSSADFADYYGNYLEVRGMEAEDFRTWIFNCREQITCASFETVKVFQNRTMELQNPLAVVVRIRNQDRGIDQNTAFLFLLDKNVLLRKLFPFQDDGLLICVCSKDGEVISSFGEGAEQLRKYYMEKLDGRQIFKIDGDGFYLQKASETSAGNTIITAIPQKQVQKETVQLLGVNIGVSVLAIAVSIAAVFYMSYRKSASVQGLLDNIDRRSRSAYVRGNEYQYIQDKVDMLADSRDEYEKDLIKLRQQIKNTMLEQMFLQEITSTKAQEFCKSYLPSSMEYFYMLIIQCEEEDSDTLVELFYLMDCYSENFLGKNCVKIQTSINEESFLIGLDSKIFIHTEEENAKIESFLQKLTEESGEIFHAGISGIGMEISNIHGCYVQAKQALIGYTREHTNTVGYYSALLDNTGEHMTDMDFMTKLYQYLLSGEKQIFSDTLDKLLRHYNVNPYLYEKYANEIYYSILHAVLCTARELNILEKDLGVESWNQNLGFAEGIRELKKAALRLMDLNEERKRSHNEVLKQNVVSYIRGHFQDPALTTDAVCREMKISEKYLIQFLKEQTGKTFSKYVEELRVERAKTLLRETDYNNEQIAQMAGFGSLNSFYRVFHKRMGVSPGTYRKQG